MKRSVTQAAGWCVAFGTVSALIFGSIVPALADDDTQPDNTASTPAVQTQRDPNVTSVLAKKKVVEAPVQPASSHSLQPTSVATSPSSRAEAAPSSHKPKPSPSLSISKKPSSSESSSQQAPSSATPSTPSEETPSSAPSPSHATPSTPHVTAEGNHDTPSSTKSSASSSSSSSQSLSGALASVSTYGTKPGGQIITHDPKGRPVGPYYIGPDQCIDWMSGLLYYKPCPVRKPPIVGPAPEPFPEPPLPTLKEWNEGLKYLDKVCLKHYKLDDPVRVEKMLKGLPEYDDFDQAFSCFKRREYNPRIYPSFHRKPVSLIPPAETSSAEASSESTSSASASHQTAQPSQGQSVPSHAASPDFPSSSTSSSAPAAKPGTVPVEPSVPGGSQMQPQPEESGQPETPSRPDVTSSSSPSVQPAQPEEAQSGASSSEAVTQGDTQASSSLASQKTSLHPSSSMADHEEAVAPENYHPSFVKDGKRYVIFWNPAEHAREYRRLSVGRAIRLMSSPTFAHPRRAKFDLMRIAPAAPQDIKLNDLLTEMGLTSKDIPWSGTGTASAISGDSDGTGAGERLTYQIQLEESLPVDKAVFAAKFQETLDKDTRYRFQRRDSGTTDVTFVIGSPSMVYQLCDPDKTPITQPDSDTPEPQSCVTDKSKKIAINLRTWMYGKDGKQLLNSDGTVDQDKYDQWAKHRQKFLKDSVDKVLEGTSLDLSKK